MSVTATNIISGLKCWKTHMQSGLCYANIIRDRKQTKHENKHGTENVTNLPFICSHRICKTNPHYMSEK